MANDKDLSRVRHQVFLCNGGGCLRRGAEAVAAHLRALVRARGLDPLVHTIKTRCANPCKHGPVVIVYPAGVWYGGVGLAEAAEVVARHLERDEVVSGLVFHPQAGAEEA